MSRFRSPHFPKIYGVVDSHNSYEFSNVEEGICEPAWGQWQGYNKILFSEESACT